MKVRTVIEDRFPKKPPKANMSKGIFAILMVTQVIYNQMLPFILGVYFAKTDSIWLFLIFVLFIFFEIRFEYKNNEIKLKITRGI